MLGRLDLVLLRASDLDRTVRFYRDLIGIPLEHGDNRRPGIPGLAAATTNTRGALLDEIFAGDAISHDPKLANIARGPQGVRQSMQVYLHRLPGPQAHYRV